MPPLIIAASPELGLVRILAAVALLAVILAFIYVLRHLRKIRAIIVEDKLMPIERAPRDDMVMVVCAIPIVVVTLLLYIIFTA